MSAEITTLNQYRKTKQKAKKEKQSASNRVRFGRSRAEKRADIDVAARIRADMDFKKLDDDPADGFG